MSRTNEYASNRFFDCYTEVTTTQTDDDNFSVPTINITSEFGVASQSVSLSFSTPDAFTNDISSRTSTWSSGVNVSSSRFNCFGVGGRDDEESVDPLCDSEWGGGGGGFMFVRIPSSDAGSDMAEENCFSPISLPYSLIASPSEGGEGEVEPFSTLMPIQNIPRCCGCEYLCGCHHQPSGNDIWSRRVRRSSKQSITGSPVAGIAHPAFPPLGDPTNCRQVVLPSSIATFNSHNRLSTHHRFGRESSGLRRSAMTEEVESMGGGDRSLSPGSPPTQLDLTGDVRTANLHYHDQRSMRNFL